MSISTVYASSTFSLSESLTDSLKTSKVDGETTYYIETAGKFSITAKILGGDINAAGVIWEELNADTPIDISLGDFSFSKTLAETDNKNPLTATKLTANWSEKTDSCDANNKCKSITTTKVSLKAAKNGTVTLTITGANNSGGISDYGLPVFSSICADNGNGLLPDETTSISMNGKFITSALSINCNVKSKTVVKAGEPYDLKTVTVKGK